MALNTEIAGVIMLSPYRSAAPKSPVRTSARRLCAVACEGGATSAVSAIIPPSPWLSARITKARYLIDMTMIRDHRISDKTPRTFA